MRGREGETFPHVSLIHTFMGCSLPVLRPQIKPANLVSWDEALTSPATQPGLVLCFLCFFFLFLISVRLSGFSHSVFYIHGLETHTFCLPSAAVYACSAHMLAETGWVRVLCLKPKASKAYRGVNGI